jgi:hypothetical protein
MVRCVWGPGPGIMRHTEDAEHCNHFSTENFKMRQQLWEYRWPGLGSPRTSTCKGPVLVTFDDRVNRLGLEFETPHNDIINVNATTQFF